MFIQSLRHWILECLQMENLLHDAIRNKNLKSLKLLLEQGADPNELGRSSSITEPVLPLVLAITNRFFEAVQLLCEHRASVTAIKGSTPFASVLHLAITKHCPTNVLETLVNHGCDVNLQTRYGTPLVTAVHIITSRPFSNKLHQRTLFTLAKLGCNYKAEHSGSTPKEYIIENLLSNNTASSYGHLSAFCCLLAIGDTPDIRKDMCEGFENVLCENTNASIEDVILESGYRFKHLHLMDFDSREPIERQVIYSVYEY